MHNIIPEIIIICVSCHMFLLTVWRSNLISLLTLWTLLWESEKSLVWHCLFWIFAIHGDTTHCLHTQNRALCVFPKLYIKHYNTPDNKHRTVNDTDRALYLFVTQSRDCVDVLLLDHEGCQVSCVGRQKDDSKESPDQDHDLTGCALGILNRDRVVEDDPPQKPHWLADCKCGTSRVLGGWSQSGEWN